MDVFKLNNYINLGYSISIISKEENKSKGTIRYWLKKYGLKTKPKKKEKKKTYDYERGLHVCPHCNNTFENFNSMGGHIMWCKRNENEKKEIKKRISNKQKGKVIPEEIRRKISDSQKKYFDENPDKTPYKLYHSSKISYPEQILIDKLNNLGMSGWEYNYSYGRYSLDFAFLEYGIDVEIDGVTHKLKKVMDKDKVRSEYLINKGWRVLRFTASEVINDVDGVIIKLKNFMSSSENHKVSDFVYITKKMKQKNIVSDNKIKLIQKIEERKDLILNSSVDFSKFGWGVELAKVITDMKPSPLVRWVKKNMPEFYNDKCWKQLNKKT